MTNALPARKDSRVRETVLSPVAPQGFPGQTNLIDFGFDGFPDPLHASPGLELLKSATFFIDAANAKDGDAYAFNKGTGGFALDARYGSSLAIGASDTNDPLLLPWTGENYLYFPGSALGGQQVSIVPTGIELNVVGDIDVIAHIDQGGTSATGPSAILNRRGSGGAYRLMLTNLNIVDFTVWIGTVAVPVTSTAALPNTDIWVRATRTTAGATTFYSSLNGVSWTQLGDVVNSTAGAIDSNTGNSLIGGTNATEPLTAKVYRVIVKNGINGTTVMDVDFTKGITSGAQTAFTCVTGQSVTITRSLSGRKTVAVTRPVWLFGTDDYMEVADNALLNMDASQSFTVLAVVRQWATAVANGRYLAKGAAGTANAYALLGNATSATLRIDDMAAATASGVSSAATAGTLRIYSGVRDKTTRTVTTYANTVAGTAGVDATVEQFTNAFPMRIGADGGASPGSYQDFELLAVAVFRRALSATEIAQINTYYGTA